MDRLEFQLQHAKAKINGYLSRKQQYVYVLGCDGYVKIGIAANIGKRLHSLRSGSPHPIEFLGMFPTIKAKEDEHDLHVQFSEFKKLGEWFTLNEWQLGKLLRRACYHYEDVELPIKEPPHLT